MASTTPPPKKRGKTAQQDLVADGVELAPFYQQIFLATHGTYNDNFPIQSSTTYGSGATPNYYFMAEPSSNELANMARYSPIAKRGTYGLATDAWINNFVLEFPGNEEANDPLTLKQINQEIYAHNIEIGLYDEFRIGTGFNYEQGEAGLMIYRKGDGDLKMYQSLMSPDPNYGGFNKEANFEKDIIRVEAVNRMDYNIPLIASFGLPQYYNINFYSTFNNFKGYNIHPSRMIRIKTDRIDYEQYNGQSKLKACFPQLTIIQNICKAAAVACHRFGYGQPWIKVRGARTKEQMAFVKNMIGNPTFEDYFITNDENITGIQMLGYQSSQIDMAGIVQMLTDQISALWQIPSPILMGKEVGVMGSEVSERSYYATLDGEHSVLSKYVRQFIAVDPFYKRLFAKYHIENYVINWGLRQVMTKEQEADWKMRVYTNITTKMRFSTFAECRAEADLPSFTAYFNDQHHPERKGKCFKLYGVDPEDLDCVVPDLGQWRQRTTMEILETPAEKTAEKQQEELMAGNVPNATAAGQKAAGVKQNPMGVSPAQKAEKELARVAGKMEREHSGDEQLKMELASTQAKEDMLMDMIKDFRTMNDEIAKKRRLSLNDIAEMGNVSKGDVTHLWDVLNKVMTNKDVIERIKQSDKGRNPK
jgi:hypothetical protein